MAEKSHAAGSAAAAMLPAVVAVILTLVWAAYTVLFVIEIAALPPPAL